MADFRQLARDDPSIRRWIVAVLLLVATTLAVWALFLLLAASPGVTKTEIAVVVEIMDKVLIEGVLPRLDSLAGDLVSAFVTAFPVAVAAVCYTNHRAKRLLNSVGNLTLGLSVLGMLASLVALTIFRSFPEGQSVEGIGAAGVVASLTSAAEVTFRTCLFYLATLVGLGGKGD